MKNKFKYVSPKETFANAKRQKLDEMYSDELPDEDFYVDKSYENYLDARDDAYENPIRSRKTGIGIFCNNCDMEFDDENDISDNFLCPDCESTFQYEKKSREYGEEPIDEKSFTVEENPMPESRFAESINPQGRKLNEGNDSRGIYMDEDGTYPAYAWPGGYPIYYIMKDNGILCPDCVNNERPKDLDDEYTDDDRWIVVGQDINYEDADLHCDHCNEKIECAYCEDEDNEEDNEEIEVENRNIKGRKLNEEREIKFRSLNEMWSGPLRDEYTDFEEFEAYDEMYNLSGRLGFDSAEEAWEANPVVKGSTDPNDYGLESEGDRLDINEIEFEGSLIDEYPVDESQTVSNAGDAKVYSYMNHMWEIITWNDEAEDHESGSQTVNDLGVQYDETTREGRRFRSIDEAMEVGPDIKKSITGDITMKKSDIRDKLLERLEKTTEGRKLLNEMGYANDPDEPEYLDNLTFKHRRAREDREVAHIANSGSPDHSTDLNWYDEEKKYVNYYKCPDCNCNWLDDDCDSMHNHHCPDCDAEIEPYESEELDSTGSVIDTISHIDDVKSRQHHEGVLDEAKKKKWNFEKKKGDSKKKSDDGDDKDDKPKKNGKGLPPWLKKKGKKDSDIDECGTPKMESRKPRGRRMNESENDGWRKGEPWFFNQYRCPDCECEWDNESTSQYDDECPDCGIIVSPFDSEEIQMESRNRRGRRLNEAHTGAALRSGIPVIGGADYSNRSRKRSSYKVTDEMLGGVVDQYGGIRLTNDDIFAEGSYEKNMSDHVGGVFDDDDFVIDMNRLRKPKPLSRSTSPKPLHEANFDRFKKEETSEEEFDADMDRYYIDGYNPEGRDNEVIDGPGDHTEFDTDEFDEFESGVEKVMGHINRKNKKPEVRRLRPERDRNFKFKHRD